MGDEYSGLSIEITKPSFFSKKLHTKLVVVKFHTLVFIHKRKTRTK